MSAIRHADPAMRASALRSQLARGRPDDDRRTPTRRRLAGFARTLRDNGFEVGLAETRDALAILAHPLAARPSSLKPALARAVLRHPFRLGALRRDLRRLLAAAAACGRRAMLSGARAASRRRRAAHRARRARRSGPHGLPDHVERRGEDGDAPTRRPRPARRRLARREPRRAPICATSSIPTTSPRPQALAERLARVDARAARAPRARRAGAAAASTCAAPSTAASRTAARRSISPGAAARIKPLRLVVLLDASGSMSLYTAFFVRFLHGVVDAFREAEAFVFHTRLAHVSASLRDRDVTRAVDRLVADGAGHRRRHQDRREPRHLQSLARAPRHQFAHRGDDRLRRLRHRRARAARARRCAVCAGAAAASSGSIR